MKNKFKLPNKFNKNTNQVSTVNVGMPTYKRATQQEINDARQTLRTHTDPVFRKAADHFRDESLSEMIFNARMWSDTLDQTLALNQAHNTKTVLSQWVQANLNQCSHSGMKAMFYMATALIGKGTYEAAKLHCNFAKA